MPSQSPNPGSVEKFASARVIWLAFSTMLILASLLIVLVACTEFFVAKRASKRQLLTGASDKAFTINTILEHRVRRADLASGSGQVLALLTSSGEMPRANDENLLGQDFSFFARNGIVAAIFVRTDGKRFQVGNLLDKPEFEVRVGAEFPASLLWKKGFYLRTQHLIRSSSDSLAGELILEQRLGALDELFLRWSTEKESGDISVCEQLQNAKCISARHGVASFDRLAGRLKSEPNAQFTFVGSTSFGQTAWATAVIGKRGLLALQSERTWEVLFPVVLRSLASTLAVGCLLVLGWFLLRRSIRPVMKALEMESRRARENEARFAAAAESSLNALYLLSSVRDGEGRIVDFRFDYLNQHAADLVGRRIDGLDGKLLCEELPINRDAGFFDKYKSIVETGIPLNEEFPINDPQIRATWLHYQVVRMQDGVAITVSNASERKTMERRLADSLAFTQSVIEASPFSTIVTDVHGLIVAANPASERLLWYSRAEMVGKMTPLAFHDPIEIALRANALAAELGKPVPPTMEVFFAKTKEGIPDDERWTYVRKDGCRIPVQLSVTSLLDVGGNLSGYMGIAYDITERKRQEDYISHIAHHDALTQLPTRLLFRDRLESALIRMARQGGIIAVFVLDLDDFKNINDSFGHHAGDEVLKAVAIRLNSCVRDTDTISRMGGDEFTVLLDHLDKPERAELIARKMLTEISQPIMIGEELFTVAASIGIAISPEGGLDSVTLLKNADVAMYHAKNGGKHNFSIFSQSLADENLRRIQLELGLKQALDLGEMSLAYQPQVDLRTGAIVGVEALIRWTSNRFGVIPPNEFIPIAEQCGLIGRLGEWILRTSCTEMSHLEKVTGVSLRLAVNLSPRQFDREDFGSSFRAILGETAFDARRLEIEITEGVLLSESPNTAETIRRFQEMGIETAIDDFGTGFSNVSYLLKLKVNRIKIDRSFIAGLLSDDVAPKAIVSSMISMANDLGVAVIAEGVEMEEQAAFLRDKGCAEAQGYLYFRPIPINSLIAVMQEKSGVSSARV